MHIEKYNRNAVGHLIEHYLRDEKIYKTQKHINPDLSGQNYMLGNSELYGMEKYKQIINTPGLKIHKRQDVQIFLHRVFFICLYLILFRCLALFLLSFHQL